MLEVSEELRPFVTMEIHQPLLTPALLPGEQVESINGKNPLPVLLADSAISVVLPIVPMIQER